MTTDEAKLKFAIDTARAALVAAAEAAHELRPSDPDDAECERDMEIALLVKSIEFLCGPNLQVLNEVARLLVEADHREHDATIVEPRPS